MKNKNHYVLIPKNFDNSSISSINVKGMKFKPLNRINYDGVKVNEMILIKPSLVEKVLKRKIKKQLNLYLQYIIQVLDTDDGEDPTNLRMALNQLTRYKKTIQNNYRVYLDDRYVELLLKKIKVLEQELKSKLLYYRMNEKNMEKEEQTNRRRR